jgi:3-hydroxyacyl-CoA dehydrogenase / enoyl-CoA hydratase / 3-hydroxybutyryl-CoA epimerase
MDDGTIRYDRRPDDIVVLTLDDPAARANTMNEAFGRSLRAAVDRLEAERETIRGVVVTSAKSTFFAGGDLNRLIAVTPADASALFDEIEAVKADLRRLETLGLPVVAAINGSALGAGVEIALACHVRLVADDARVEIGFPEVTLGLLPGAGGVTRTVRMLGLQKALVDVLLEGKRMRPGSALEVGIVDQVVAAPDLLSTAVEAVERMAADPELAVQPWDRADYRMPGGTPSSPKLAAQLPAFPATLRRQLKGAPYPAPRAILAAAVEGASVDFDTATRIESRYFVELATGPIAKNMIQAFFFDLRAVNAGASRPPAAPAFAPRRIGVVGAGMMGAGIAAVAARAGAEVVVKDVTVDDAARARARTAALLDPLVAKGRISSDERDAVLDRVQPTDKASDLADCDVVIEAVFENARLKREVFAELDGIVSAEALLCSNTSTLPITGLAEAVSRPADFIGLHFFSPVERMPLVEIIVGRQTSDAAIAKAYDVVRLLKKTPIVVNDSRGFFTSRVFGTLVLEGAAMVGEGVSPVTVERLATQAGFPAPPLAMLDEVSLTLSQSIRDEARSAASAAGAEPPPDHPGMAVIDRMVDEFGRMGKAAGAGFYDYPDGEPKRLWTGLAGAFAAAGSGGPTDDTLTDEAVCDAQERLTFAMAIETLRCIEEGVLRSTPEANIGSIFGIGFPSLHGGAVQYVNGYRGVGPSRFLDRARELRDRYGERFEPPRLLVDKAGAGRRL